MNWKFWKKTQPQTDYKDLIMAIMDGYEHSMKSRGVKWSYQAIEDVYENTKIIKIVVNLDKKRQLILFHSHAASRVVNLNDLWRNMFMSITMSGVASVYNATLQAEQHKGDPLATKEDHNE